jgi:hypothetical protein
MIEPKRMSIENIFAPFAASFGCQARKCESRGGAQRLGAPDTRAKPARLAQTNEG